MNYMKFPLGPGFPQHFAEWYNAIISIDDDLKSNYSCSTQEQNLDLDSESEFDEEYTYPIKKDSTYVKKMKWNKKNFDKIVDKKTKNIIIKSVGKSSKSIIRRKPNKFNKQHQNDIALTS